MPASTPNKDTLTGPPASVPERPRWSASEAARRCNVGRATIQRALAAGRIPGATETEKGWSIPLDGLLAAGFTPDRPSPSDQQPAEAPSTDREQDRAPDTPNREQARRLAELEKELERERARADIEQARRIAAEQLAAERAERVTDLRHALRMLEAPRPTPAPEPSPVASPAPSTPRAKPEPVQRLRTRLIGRVLRR